MSSLRSLGLYGGSAGAWTLTGGWNSHRVVTLAPRCWQDVECPDLRIRQAISLAAKRIQLTLRPTLSN